MSSDRSSTSESSSDQIPQSFGRFRIQRLLGRGGMGLVYLADDPKKDRRVALKVLARDKASNETLLKRFRSEALATRELKHDNIVGVFEAGSIDGQFYIALEYVDGTDVARLIQSRDRLSVRRSLDITRQVALALSVAHQRNIVHRDIKPSNLLIRHDGVVKLTDMGLARSLDDSGEAGITRAGTTVGTVDYISPEQARDSKSADVRSDIYSLGCTWYHMLTGQAPFPNGSLTEKLRHHATTPAPDPRRISDSIPEDVVIVLQRMLEKSPDRRFQDPDDLLSSLTAIDLDRRELSADVIAALADEDTTPSEPAIDASGGNDPRSTRPPRRRERQPPGESGRSAPSPGHTDSAQAASLTTTNVPPPSPRSRRGVRRIEEESDDHGGGGIDWEKAKSVAIMLIGVSLLALIGYILVNLGQSVDMSGAKNHGNLFSSDNGKRADGRPNSGTSETGPEQGAARPAVAYDTLPPPVLMGEPALPPQQLPSLRQGERRHVFDWAVTPRSGQRPVLSVAGGHDRPGQFHSLDAAVAALTDQGGWIQLAGPGPFFLTGTTLVDCGRVRISPPTATRAVVVLLPDPESRSTALRLRNTHLELDRVDLALPETGFPGQGRLALFWVDSSDFSLTNCSITQPHAREGGTVAVSTTGSVNGRGSRILLDRVLCRGRNTTSIELDSRSVDAALVNSLLVSDTASPLRLLTPTSSPSRADGRHIRLVSCTLSSQAPLLTLDSGTMDADIPSTTLALVNTLMAIPAGGERVLLDLGRWPQRIDPAPGESRFQGLEWHQHSSIAFGVRRFIGRDPAAGLAIDSYAEWQSCWPQPGEAAAFVARPWRTLKVAAHLVTPAYFDTRRFGDRLRTATDGNAPGCRVLALSQAEPTVLARATGLARRPAWLHPRPAPRPLLSLNLSDHPNLGRFLAEHPPPPNAVIIVHGSGRRVTSPIIVGGGGLKLIFKDSSKELPLVLVPEPPNTVADAGSSPDTSPPTSLFSVTGGTLELVGGRFQLLERGGPPWLLQVADGHFVLRNCSLLGPRGPSQTPRGLVDWSGATSGGSGRILGSFLAGGGILVRTRCQDRSLLVADSLLFSTGSVFGLDLQKSGHSILDIRRSTLSAANAVFLLRPAKPVEPKVVSTDNTNSRLLDLFIDETVFAAGISPTAGDHPLSAILSCRSRTLQTGLLQWWGTHNGFSSLLTDYLVDRGSQGTDVRKGTARHFASLFPAPHRIRPLHGPRGVPLAAPTPAATHVRPSHFRMAPSSRGLKWASGGRPLGANLDQLDAQLGNVGPPPTTKPGGKPDF